MRLSWKFNFKWLLPLWILLWKCYMAGMNIYSFRMQHFDFMPETIHKMMLRYANSIKQFICIESFNNIQCDLKPNIDKELCNVWTKEHCMQSYPTLSSSSSMLFNEYTSKWSRINLSEFLVWMNHLYWLLNRSKGYSFYKRKRNENHENKSFR